MIISQNKTYVICNTISLIVFVILESVLYHKYNVYLDIGQLQNMMKNSTYWRIITNYR